MSRPNYGSKRQGPSALRNARCLAADAPSAPLVLLAHEIIAPAPVQLFNPQLVRDPVALPIVRPRINQHADTAFKQLRHLVLSRRDKFVHVCAKCATDRIRSCGEIGRGFCTQKFTDVWGVEEVAYDRDFQVA